MNHLKILGLAVVAAAALTAFVGAGSASADVACTTNTTSECASSWRIRKFVTSQIGSGVIRSTSGETLNTCTGTTLEWEDEKGSETAEPEGKVSSVAWSGCSSTTDTVAGGTIRIETKETAGGVHDNTVVSVGLKVTMNIFGVSCTYGTGTGTSLGDLTIGSPAIMHYNFVDNKVEGSFLCPSTTRWESTTQVTNHTGVWVSKK